MTSQQWDKSIISAGGRRGEIVLPQILEKYQTHWAFVFFNESSTQEVQYLLYETPDSLKDCAEFHEQEIFSFTFLVKIFSLTDRVLHSHKAAWIKLIVCTQLNHKGEKHCRSER